MIERKGVITPDTAIIDIISSHRKTERVFKQLEKETGTCICCEGMFLSLQDAAGRFGFRLEDVMEDLNAIVSEGK